MLLKRNLMQKLVKTSVVIGAVFVVLGAWIVPGAFAQLLDPGTHPKFVNPLPVIKDLGLRIDATNGGKFDIDMREIVQWLGLVDVGDPGDPNDDTPLMTTVWGYGLSDTEVATYPGPTFVAQRDVPVLVKWKNKLPKAPHLLPVDTSIHLAESIKEPLKKKFIPTVTHLHGGHTESASDGLPEAWFTQGYKLTGLHFVKRRYTYDNDQEAATLWYHDHALGITRLNVYAGLAGFYLLRDENENQLIADGVLPGGPYEIEIVIQDRQFTADGQLRLPSSPQEVGDIFEYPPDVIADLPDPTVAAEFFGDFILVNGMAWPKLEVEPRPYRFRLLNGSDSRFYVLEFRDDQLNGDALSFLQIGTDDGFLQNPVSLQQLVIGPGERADLVVDFTDETAIFLRNFGPDEPFGGLPVDAPADVNTTGQIMKFVVNQDLSGVPKASVDTGTDLRSGPFSVADGAITRPLILFEGEDEFGRLQPMLGTTAAGKLSWFADITENPEFEASEIWEIYNLTADAHPIHLHLVAFEIVDRQDINVFDGEDLDPTKVDPETGAFLVDPSTVLVGDPFGPALNEQGPKDTVQAFPGQVTRVKAFFDRPGRYVWHCHILSHEDHEMMRPYVVE